jgi:hypothetical protein
MNYMKATPSQTRRCSRECSSDPPGAAGRAAPGASAARSGARTWPVSTDLYLPRRHASSDFRGRSSESTTTRAPDRNEADRIASHFSLLLLSGRCQYAGVACCSVALAAADATTFVVQLQTWQC